MDNKREKQGVPQIIDEERTLLDWDWEGNTEPHRRGSIPFVELGIILPSLEAQEEEKILTRELMDAPLIFRWLVNELGGKYDPELEVEVITINCEGEPVRRSFGCTEVKLGGRHYCPVKGIPVIDFMTTEDKPMPT